MNNKHLAPPLFDDSISSGSIIYGIHPVEELIATRLRQIERLYFDKERSSGPLFEIVKSARKERLPYQMVPTRKLDQICGSTKHQGVVAQCAMKEYTEPDVLLERLAQKPTPPLLVVPASVEDPRNLGALLRTCVAFGVDAVLLERKNTAPLGPAAAKASAGMIDHISLVKPKNLEGLIGTLASRGFAIVGARTGAGKKPQDIDFSRPSVLVMGGENRGIPPYLAKQCTETAGIPIAPPAQSLNVSAAAAILLYECARQRSFPFVAKA
jgi:23S rRNA (guanosine2251-2'-O)-methyltransferase